MVTLHKPKKQVRKLRYIEYDIHDINNIIYNDLENPIYKETKQIDWNLNKVLEKGEYAKLINSNSGCHYITSFGRVINAKRLVQLRVQNIRNSFLRYFLDQTAYRLEDTMAIAGFEYNYDEIVKYYATTQHDLKWVKG